MSIPELLHKIKDFGGIGDRRGAYTACLFVLVAISAFCLGIMAERALSHDPISIEAHP